MLHPPVEAADLFDNFNLPHFLQGGRRSDDANGVYQDFTQAQ
jgi:hypothetical protein